MAPASGTFSNRQTARADFLKSADATDAQQNANQHCEANFYVGRIHELSGDKPGALAFFQKSVDTNVKSYPEYMISQAKLK